MASIHLVLIAAVIVCFCQFPAHAFRKRSTVLVTRVSKEPVTQHYTVEIAQGTPIRVLQLMLDIEHDYMWLPCNNKSYTSSTYRPVDCITKLCKSYQHSACGACYAARGPGCNNHTCAVPGQGTTRFEVGQDNVALVISDGSGTDPLVRFPRVACACAVKEDLSKLPEGAAGVAGMSSSTLALPAQLAAVGEFSLKFAMCLTSENSQGYLFFGDGPLVFYPLMGNGGTDLSRHLIRTPFIKNSVYPDLFYIGVRGLKVNGVQVAIDADKLRIGAGGSGGTKLSTVASYTQLATPIYNSLVRAFTKAAGQMNISRVASVPPFGACFNPSGMLGTSVGPTVPTIDILLQGTATTTWRIFGANSMVGINGTVLCLAFVDAGEDPVASIVMGTYQFQQTLVQFDVAKSTFGVSPYLLSLKTKTRCSNFNFSASM